MLLEQSTWKKRDWLAAAGLFLATAAVVLWQNAHIAVLWDISYVLDSALRIAQGQMPYRDFPFVHAPLPFLIQAALIRLTGRVYWHSAVYAACVGGAGTVLTWRMILRTLHGEVAAPWLVSLLLAAPLTVLGLYCVFPFPSYDCDCVFSVLIALWFLQRLMADETTESQRGVSWALATGAALCLPLFFKQNVGLPFLLVALPGLIALLALRRFIPAQEKEPEEKTLLAVLAGIFTTLLTAALLLHFTAGLENYFHWTVRFAMQRRMASLNVMAEIYHEPALLWMLPAVAAGLALIRFFSAKLWTRWLGIALLAAPFFWTVLGLLLYDDADERGDCLLSLWPLLLLISALLALVSLRRGLGAKTLFLVLILTAIHGTLLSQQLWGSTYALWPLLMLLVAEMLAWVGSENSWRKARAVLIPALASSIAAALLLCGAMYTASEERLSYADYPDGPILDSAFPALRGMATTGSYLAQFDELLRYAEADIPANDGVILLPGEDPFYFATGREPQFPVLLFDPATQPYSPAELGELARKRNIHWLIVKRNLQLKDNPMPQREEAMRILTGEFTLVQRLAGYDIYKR